MDMFLAINEHLIGLNIQNVTVSRTTLSLAVFDRVDRVLMAASAGDSHVYFVGRSSASNVATGTGAGRFFLGQSPISRPDLAAACAAVVMPVVGARGVVLASDGISTDGIGFDDPCNAVYQAVGDAVITHPVNWSLAAARALVTRCCQVQEVNGSGDDISVAVGEFGAIEHERER